MKRDKIFASWQSLSLTVFEIKIGQKGRKSAKRLNVGFIWSWVWRCVPLQDPLRIKGFLALLKQNHTHVRELRHFQREGWLYSCGLQPWSPGASGKWWWSQYHKDRGRAHSENPDVCPVKPLPRVYPIPHSNEVLQWFQIWSRIFVSLVTASQCEEHLSAVSYYLSNPC